MLIRLLLALALLSGLTTPAAAQGAAASPPPEMVKAITEVASSDAAVQEAAANALGKTGDRKILPLLEALREGSVYVRTLPGGKKETVIVGDKVNEGDKTLVPIFTAYGVVFSGGPLFPFVAIAAGFAGMAVLWARAENSASEASLSMRRSV